MPNLRIDLVAPDNLVMHDHSESDLGAVLDSRYLKLDASNDPVTGQLALNIATGTSPFLITSTTVNTNLNADLLDGLHDTAFIILSPTSSTRNIIQPTNAAYIPLIIKGASSQTANLTEWQNSSGTVLSGSDSQGRLFSYGRSGITSNFFTGGAGNGTLTGTYDVGIGTGSLALLTSGTFNFALGPNTLGSITTGSNNLAIGYKAGEKMGTSSNVNVAMGFGSLSNGTGVLVANVGIGAFTLYDTTSGYNIGIGYCAGRSNTSGSYNLYLGCFAGYRQTGSHIFIVDQPGYRERETALEEQQNALFYGITAATASGQTLRINAKINSDKDTVPLTVIGAASQVANLQEWQNSSANALAYITKDGAIGVNRYFTNDSTVLQAGEYIYVGSIGSVVSQTKEVRALTFEVERIGSNTVSGNTTGVYGVARTRTTANVSGAITGGAFRATLSTTSGTAVASNVYGLTSSVANENSTGAVITNAFGLNIDSFILTGAITNAYGIYVNSISGASTLNYAIYTNAGNVRLGDDLILNGADSDKIWLGAGKDMSIYYDGTNAIINPKEVGTGYLNIKGKVLIDTEVEIDGDLNHDGSNIGFFGTTPTSKQTALTTADTNTINTGDATTDAVIANMRTRIGELESKLQAYGLLS